MTFPVTFIKQIHGGFSAAGLEDVYLERSFMLPFIPFPGLIVWDGDFEATVTEVNYYAQEKQFKVYTEENKEIYNAMLNRQRHRPIEEIVQDYLDVGWYRSEK